MFATVCTMQSLGSRASWFCFAVTEGSCGGDSCHCFLRLRPGPGTAHCPSRPLLGKRSWTLRLLSGWSRSLAEHRAQGRRMLGSHGPSSGGRVGVGGRSQECWLVFSGSPTLGARDGKGMEVRTPCRCSDSFFSRTEEYLLLCFEDKVITLVATEHSFPSLACVLTSCSRSQSLVLLWGLL